ncbi:MAG: hypothetical protein FWH48_00735 [Oscillospiraceae bacterium]|nr:hypothetical protein [Oscillospiraceae bacterium]
MQKNKQIMLFSLCFAVVLAFGSCGTIKPDDDGAFANMPAFSEVFDETSSEGQYNATEQGSVSLTEEEEFFDVSYGNSIVTYVRLLSGPFKNESGWVQPISYLPVSCMKENTQLLTQENMPDNLLDMPSAVYSLIGGAPSVDALDKISTEGIYTEDSDQYEITPDNEGFRGTRFDYIASNGDWDFFPAKVTYKSYTPENQPDNPEWVDYFKKQILQLHISETETSEKAQFATPVVIYEAWIFDWNGTKAAVVTASNVVLTDEYPSDKQSGECLPPENKTAMYVLSAIFTSGNEPLPIAKNYCEISQDSPISYLPKDEVFRWQEFSCVQFDEDGKPTLYPAYTVETTGDSTYLSFKFGRPICLLCDIDGDTQTEIVVYKQGSNSPRTWLYVYKLLDQKPMCAFCYGNL